MIHMIKINELINNNNKKQLGIIYYYYLHYNGEKYVDC